MRLLDANNGKSVKPGKLDENTMPVIWRWLTQQNIYAQNYSTCNHNTSGNLSYYQEILFWYYYPIIHGKVNYISMLSK